jgi:hypothetical protein
MWSTHPLSEDDIKHLEAESIYNAEYCSWCDFGEGLPEDDCFCDGNCGVTGCQGLNSLKEE